MKDILNKVKSISLVVTTLMSVDSWIKSRASDRTNKILEESLKQYQERLEYINDIKSVLEIKSEKSSIVYTNISSTYGRVLEYFKQLQANSTRIGNYNEDSEANKTIIEEIRKESVEILDRISTEITDFENKSGRELDNMIKSILDADQTKLVNEFLNNFQMYLDTLTTDQKGALAHLLFSITIIYFAWTISTLYYADKLIIYFDLENKYPRFARLFKYRRTIQHYSIGFNLSMIFLISGYFAYVNILIFNGL